MARLILRQRQLYCEPLLVRILPLMRFREILDCLIPLLLIEAGLAKIEVGVRV